MLLPRLLALAERAWTSKGTYEDFLMRLETEFKYLDSQSIYYYDPRSFTRHPEPQR